MMAENKPIIRLFLVRPTEPYFKLSQQEIKESHDKLFKKLEELGGKYVIACDCRWSNEEWMGFGVQEFPDIEAEQGFTKFMEGLEWWRYCEAKTYLGTPVELP